MMQRYPMLLAALVILAAVACTTRAQRRTGPSAQAVYVDDSPPLPPTAEERQRGFVLFSREMTRVLFPAAVPTAQERVDRLHVSAAPGEYEPAILVVRGLRKLAGVRVTIGDLAGPRAAIPASQVEVRSVRYAPKQGQARWGPFGETLMEVPLFLEKRDAVEVSANANQPFWLTVHVPGSSAPGDYAGTVQVAAQGSPGAQIPFTLSVRPFRLAEPAGITFGLYEKLRPDRPWMAACFADMRAHGMTGVGLAGNARVSMSAEGGSARIDWSKPSALAVSMEEYARTAFPQPALWGMGRDVPDFCEQQGPVGSQALAKAYRGLVTQIVEHGRQAGWPEIIFQPVDEPFDDPSEIARGTEMLRILKSIPGVRTEMSGPDAGWERVTDEVYRLTDAFGLHDGPNLRRRQLDMNAWWRFRQRSEGDGKRVWFCNIDLTAWHPEPMRFMTGFGLWASQGDGVLQWSYMFPVNNQDPGQIYDYPDRPVYFFPAAPGEVGGPTIGLEAMREGIDDYRYLLTLSQLVEQAKQAGKGGLADGVWRPIQAKLDAASFQGSTGAGSQGDWTGRTQILANGQRVVSGEHKLANNWDFGDYDALREQIAAGIIRLQEALGR